MNLTRADYEHAAAVIRSRTSLQLKVGLVLGSGLGRLADEVEEATAIPYADIPGFPVSTVHGHRGEIVVGLLEGQPVIMQRGRTHFYEGYSPQQITFPIRVMQMLGVSTLILTNAAGAVNKAYQVGDLMLLNDHLNFVGMAGNNPLMGANDDSLGPRFVGMSRTYDRHLRTKVREIAAEANIPLHEGVYACLSGPFFETPAEIRMLRTLGADTVGMSTVHEVLVARHAGMRVVAFSGITNATIDTVDADFDINHEAVLEAGAVLVPRLTRVLRGLLQMMDL